jgi:hypothetical protein
MANETGVNQYGSAIVQPKFGDVAKHTQLLQSAPLSGAPVAAQALNAPRRGAQQAKRGRQAQPQVQEQAPAFNPAGGPPGPDATFQAIASIPGVTPVWQELLA